MLPGCYANQLDSFSIAQKINVSILFGPPCISRELDACAVKVAKDFNPHNQRLIHIHIPRNTISTFILFKQSQFIFRLTKTTTYLYMLYWPLTWALRTHSHGGAVSRHDTWSQLNLAALWWMKRSFSPLRDRSRLPLCSKMLSFSENRRSEYTEKHTGRALSYRVIPCQV